MENHRNTPLDSSSLRLLLGELVLAYRAERAKEILRDFLPWSARCNTGLRTSYFRIVYPTAYVTYILFHTSDI